MYVERRAPQRGLFRRPPALSSPAQTADADLPNQRTPA